VFIRRPTPTGSVRINLALVTWVDWAHRKDDGSAGVEIHFAGGGSLPLTLDAKEAEQLQALLSQTLPPPGR
jgi:hypothetical protein